MKLKTTTQLFPNLSNMDSSKELVGSYSIDFKNKKIFLLIFLFIQINFSAISQLGLVSYYTFSETTGTYTSISGGVQLVTTTAGATSYDSDCSTFSLAAGNQFIFKGVLITSVSMSADGSLWLNPNTATTANGVSGPISTSANAAGIVSAFGMDLRSTTLAGQVYERRWEDDGTEVVFQWKNAARYSLQSSERFSFQIRVNKSTGVIKVVYGEMISIASSIGYQPQVGLRGASNTDYINRKLTTTVPDASPNWGAPNGTTAGTTNGDNCRFTSGSPSCIPSSGLTFIWTPASTLYYCEPTYASVGSADFVTQVSLTGINGTLTKTTASNGSSPYYRDYTTTQNIIPQLSKGSTYSLNLTFSTDGSQYNGVWIDFNQDGILSTSEFFTSNSNAGASGTVSVSITVPVGAVTSSSVLMRVRGGDDSQPTSSQACGASGSAYGQTQDYYISVVSSTPTLTLANATTAIAVSNICASSTSVPIHAFNITGTNTGGTLTNFTFTTTGSYLSADVSNFKILYNSSNTTSGATTLATLSTPGVAGSKTFTAFSQAIGNATGYFWITMDVASGATNGGTITVSASASTDMTTTVTKAGSAIASGTQTLKAAPTSTAGSAQSVCSTATLAATNPGIGTGVWSLVSGSGTITTSSAYNSGVTGLGVGANVFRWTVSNSPCSAATSDVTITLLATSTVFYSASTGNLNTLSNWWSNTDGSTGCNPLNFTTANTTYYITNRTTATIGAAWSVSGASSKVVLGQASAAAVTFTIPNNYAFIGTIDITAASSGSNTLVINNTSIPTFGTLNVASTVKYNAANSQTISVATYGNLETGVESGTSNYNKTAAGILDINGNLTIGDYTTLNLSTYSHTLAGHMIKASSNSTFTAIAGTITFDGTSIQHINVVDPTTATITPCDADISFGNIIINGSNVCLWYNKTSDKKINIVDFTVNVGKSAKFYSGPAVP